MPSDPAAHCAPRSIRYTLVASKKAMEQAKMYTDEEQEGLDKTRVGVLVGSGMGGLQVFQDGVENLVQKGHKRITPFFIPYAITNMGSAMVAIDHGFMGPNYSISTACATANYCYHLAARHILQPLPEYVYLKPCVLCLRF